MSESSESDDGPANWTRQGRGTGKNSRKIVMRIEFDDSSSGSESASDEEPIIKPSGSGRRRQGGGGKRLISSDDDDSSSGSEITRTVVVRGRNKHKAVIVEDDSPAAVDEPTSSGATASPSGAPPPPQQSSSVATAEDGFASDSSNDDLEKCPICLLSLRNQEIGKPSVCDHLFCAICIEEWSHNVRTCPIDRRDFDSIIVQESINNRKFVREIIVQGPEKADFETEAADVVDVEAEQLELEHCQICHHPDREDVMLLCDGCNRGYHMDCLSPALTEIPESFWYCDDCFQSEEEDLQEEMNVLMEDLREMGVPEQRLRVREVRQPRIPRTRQSERIRASIVARTRRSNTRITSDMNFAQASSSRQVTPSSSRQVTASTSSSSTRRRPIKKRRTRRRTGRKRRTYVVEYDVDNFDQKFEVKTTKKVVRKRKISKRGSRRKIRKTTTRTSCAHKQKNELNDFLALRAARENSSVLSQPRFSLFGGANDLEYFSDESDGDEIALGGGGGDSEVGPGGTAIQTSIRIHSFTSGRSLARRKGIVRDLDQPRQPDILSSILDMQDRFHSATQHNRISAVTIAPDGTLKLPEKKETSGEKKKTDSNQNVAPSDINQAPMYPRGGGGNNYNNNSGGGGGAGGYNNRFNNQSNYRNSTGGGGGGSGGGGGGGAGGQFRGGSFSGGNNSSGNSGGFLFNAFRRDSNTFPSDNGFQQNRTNNSDNNTPNRGRFRQNQNQNQLQRRNQSNQNRYSGPPNTGNDNNMNRNPADASPNLFNAGNLTSRPPPLFGIGSGSLFPTPTKSESTPPVQTTPLNMSNNSRNANNFSVPLHQPPPPILPVYGPINITGPDPLPPPPSTPEDLSRTAPIVPPLAPPPWNQNLFRLTSDYADSNDEDDDDDSNCPNFSVYSAESFQVARSGESAASKVTDSEAATQGGNVDSESVRQEDEYEENEEDLVQLGDDDDIPDALEKGKPNNSNENQNQEANTVPESEIYEPEFPTVEAPDDDDEDDDENPEASKDDDDEDKSQKVEDDEKDDDEADSETENKDGEDGDADAQDDESPEGTSLDAECTDQINKDQDESDKETGAAKSGKIPKLTKKGDLQLYDDSDYEDIVDKPEFIPMPPDEERDEAKVASSNAESAENEEHYTPEIDRSDDLEKDDKCSPVEEEGTPSKEPDIDRRTPDEEGTPELDDAKLQELAKRKQTDSVSEDEEPERSYTPCLDEKEHEEANGECREQNTSRSEEKADDSHGNVSTNVIDGMEMELISEEDEDILNDDPNKSNKGNDRGNRKDDGGGKRSRREQFKKISKNTKERNYRDKENRGRPRRRATKSRSRLRSHSKGKENRNRQRPPPRRARRKEIERYNVRNVINQPRSFKDRYGRDTSRPARTRTRSRSRSIRRLRSKSRSRSVSPNKDRRSFSMSPTPISAGRPSPRRISPRRFSPARRVSPRRRYSPRRSRSRSRSRRRSRSLRKTSLPRRRSRTPIRPRSRSLSPGRPNNRRNQRLRRQPSPRSVSRSFSHSVSKFGSRSRSPPPKSPRRSRSGSPLHLKNKRKRSKDRKKKRGKKRALSMSPSPLPNRAPHSADRAPAPARKKKKRVRSKSPLLETERWSQSPEHLPEAGMLSSQPNDSSWTPPLVGANSDNLTVILKNKNAVNGGAGKKKRDKKKKTEKRRDVVGRKEKRRQRSEMRESPVAPSKEVFASGNNILVSVSFNKDNPAPPQQTTVVTLPPTREEIMSKRRSAERQPRKQKRSKDKIQRRRKKIDAKPVAIIDLDRSPFQIIQSPRDVIVLTDESDREGDADGGNKRKNSNTGLEINVNDRVHDEMQMNSIDKTVDMQRPNQMEEDDQFELQQLGPKTPPDPPSTIKFSLAKSKQIKARNPLHDEQEELQEQTEPEHSDVQMPLHSANKIGPNTPPESGPCSPDAYDPFDPTKSPSMSPSHSPPPPTDSAAEVSPEKIAHSQESNAVEQRPAAMSQDKNMNPVDLVMALINTKSSMSQQDMLNKNSDTAGYQMKSDGADSLNMAGDENLPIKSITVLSNVLISSGKSQNRNNPMLNTSPPISKLPIAKQSTSRQNGGAGISNDDIAGGVSNEPESPYSPGSGDYDDLFEPPPASAENTISLAQLAHNRKANKNEMYDNLFGSTSPVGRGQNSRRKSSRNAKKAKVAKTKLEDDQVKIFDELPSSAVELQVKDKFLRKLNRQERVVEEVKVVLKPHYNKKRITKDDYKEILRRAVPKICHSRSGEINPAKIKTLIEAYVKKFRQRNKLNLITGQVSSAVKCAAYLKKL